MSWFKTDDRFLEHPKARAAGKDGRALWFAAGTKCAESEGVVAAPMVGLYAALAEVAAKRASGLLVASGLWHSDETIRGCPRCRKGVGHTDGWAGVNLEPGAFYFHDWRDYQLDPAAKREKLKKANDARRKRLKRHPWMEEAIIKRDESLCRYCGVLVTWDDPKSTWGHRGSFDHVDPFGDNSMENVVVACANDNFKVKKQRTLEQAGLVLLKPGTTAAQVAASVDIAHLSVDWHPMSAPLELGRPHVTRDSGRAVDGVGSVRGLAGVGLVGSVVGLVSPGSDLKDPTEGGAER